MVLKTRWQSGPWHLHWSLANYAWLCKIKWHWRGQQIDMLAASLWHLSMTARIFKKWSHDMVFSLLKHPFEAWSKVSHIVKQIPPVRQYMESVRWCRPVFHHLQELDLLGLRRITDCELQTGDSFHPNKVVRSHHERKIFHFTYKGLISPNDPSQNSE